MWKLVVTILFVASGETDGPYTHGVRFKSEADCIVAIHRDLGELIDIIRQKRPNEDFKLDASCQKADREAHKRR